MEKLMYLIFLVFLSVCPLPPRIDAWQEPNNHQSEGSLQIYFKNVRTKTLNLSTPYLSWEKQKAPCAAENVTVVYGIEGGTISVNCTYNPWQQRWREKSWCKLIDKTKCQHVVSARRFWLPFLKNRNGTTSISDNVHDGVLTVTMKRLKKEDAGLYQCKSDYLGETNSLRKVQVEVLAAVLETQMPEEPRAVQGISSIPPEADFTVLYIIAGFLVTKFVVAVLIFLIGMSRKNRETEQNPNEHQVLPFTGNLAHDGMSPSWDSTA